MGKCDKTLRRGRALSIGDHVERMIEIQMQAYPDDWTEVERREMAVKHLGLKGEDDDV